MKSQEPRAAVTLSLDKALQLMSCFSLDQAEWSLTDLTLRLKMSKPTVMRLAHTLEARGYLSRTAAGKYRLGFELVRLSHVCLVSLDIRKLAEPLLRQLVDKHDETVYLGLWQGDRVVYISRVDCSHPLRYQLEVGTHLPFHAGSAAKAIAAFLPEAELAPLLSAKLPMYTENTLTEPALLRQEFERIRTLGYATSKSERLAGVAGVGAPVFGADGRAMAAIAISIPQQRITPGRVEEVAEDVLVAAKTLSQAMGFTGTKPGAATKTTTL